MIIGGTYMEYFKLNNGIEISSVGIGTYMLSPEDAEVSVREALKMGYRFNFTFFVCFF